MRRSSPAQGVIYRDPHRTRNKQVGRQARGQLQPGHGEQALLACPQAGRRPGVLSLQGLDERLQPLLRLLGGGRLEGSQGFGHRELILRGQVGQDLLADLGVVEKRIERLRGQKKLGKENAMELGALEKILPVLEAEGRVASVGLDEAEKEILRGFAFLTERPVLIVVNQDEEGFRTGAYPGAERLAAFARAHQMRILPICARLELEISRLEPAERAFFLADLNAAESGIDRLARAAYELLGLISFFTIGAEEVKAWTIEAGTDARRAAGKVHSDMEKGFIRAEVVNFQDLERLGSMAKVREKGLFRLEGKEYLVQDGDIITFRFNV